MKKISLFVFALALGCVAFPHRSPAPLVVRQGEGASYVAPGGEEIPNQKDAQSQFDAALEAEKKGKIGTAINGYRKTVRRFPKSTVAAAAQYKVGELMEKLKNYQGAAEAYERTIVAYPHSADFNAALEGEFRIGNLYVDGLRQKVLGVPTLPSRTKAILCFNVIVRNAPFSRYSPMAQFNIGRAYQMEGDPKSAIDSYQVIVDKYPTDPICADALYQIGFAWMTVSRTGSYDRTAAQRAREAFEDFLSEYPNHEKAAQARENIASLGNQQTGGSLKIADYYYKQKQFRAAVVYYNDVIRQQPNSPDSQRAKTKLDQIRAKYGEKYFTDAAPAAGGKPVVVNPKLGDGRLQAQSDTSKRPDYVGPPVSAPTPPPTVAGGNAPAPGNLNLPPGPSGSPGPRPEPQPPTVPEGEQPSLPSQ